MHTAIARPTRHRPTKARLDPVWLRAELPAVTIAPGAKATHDFLVPNPRPDLIFDALGLKQGDVVADVGCGSGYVARLLVARVLPQGKVYCNDIQAEMLEIMKQESARAGVTGIEPVLGTLDDAKLPAGKIDWILLVDVYHEMSRPEQMLANMRGALAANGRIALLEYRLEAQFRCAGSDGFVNWVNNTLGLERTANVLWDAEKESFEFRIFDRPWALEAAIRAKAEDGACHRCDDQSTASPARVPQLKPSLGRFRLTISTRYSFGTRDGRPTITTPSPTWSVSRVMPLLASCAVPLHSTAHRCDAPFSSGACTCTKEWGLRKANCTSFPSRRISRLVS